MANNKARIEEVVNVLTWLVVGDDEPSRIEEVSTQNVTTEIANAMQACIDCGEHGIACALYIRYICNMAVSIAILIGNEFETVDENTTKQDIQKKLKEVICL